MYPKLGPIELYPVMIVIGIAFVFLFLELYFRKIKMKRPLITSIELVTVLSIGFGFISANLFQNLYDFIQDPKNFHWGLGITFYGGLIGGTAAFLLLDFLWLKKKYGPHFSSILIIAPSCIAVAHGFGRIGCFLNGCCYGKPSDSFFALKFVTTETKVLPTNLWEAIFMLMMAVILFALAYRKNFPYGMVIYMMGYGVWRFFIEYFRGDYRGSFIPGLTPSQFWSILLFIGGIVYLLFELKYQKKHKQIEKENR